MIDHPVWLLLVILATARVVRFVVDDKLSLPVRQWAMSGIKENSRWYRLPGWIRWAIPGWVAGGFGPESKITYLLHCRWCVAIWVSAAMVPYAWFGTGHLWAQLPVTALAVALLAPALLSIDELKPNITVNSREGEPWR